jgi:hypothetical protein
MVINNDKNMIVNMFIFNTSIWKYELFIITELLNLLLIYAFKKKLRYFNKNCKIIR